MNNSSRAGTMLATAWIAISWQLLFCCAAAKSAAGQQIDSTQILQKIDAAVKARFDGIQGYTDFEHYVVYRNGDQSHPAAEMRVKATYNRDTGKVYDILSASGSTLLRDLVLDAILENEKQVNDPHVRAGSWITTANYNMTVNAGGISPMDSRDCVVVTLEPRRREPYLLYGTLWVNAQDGSIVRIEGTASKSSSVFTGPTTLMRQYATVGGFSQAIRARAESDSTLFGRTVVIVDYSDYQIQPRTAR
jgi:hypothetical protein